MEFKDNGQGFNNYQITNNDINMNHLFFWIFIISISYLIIK